VVEHIGESLSLLTVVPDGNGGGAFGLLRISFFVVLAVAKPLTNLVALLDFNEWNVVALGKGLHTILELAQVQKR